MATDTERRDGARGCPYGSHRASGGMPQPAVRVDPSPEIWSNELRVDVELLNLDATSFHQIEHDCGGDHRLMAAQIREIVDTRGKMQNPVTRSGGVLVGRVAEIGRHYPNRNIAPGDRICPIVSLSLIPMTLDSIGSINARTCQVAVRARAILFETAVFSKVPDDLPLTLTVGLIDICGAPARISRLAKRGDAVAILGAGKAGLVSAYAARETIGEEGRLLVVDVDENAIREVRRLGVANDVMLADLTRPLDALRAIEGRGGGAGFDVVVSVTAAPDTEGAAILISRQGGRILFFGMSTSFQIAALSAEGAGRDVDMFIGNGYVPSCIEECISLVRRHPPLRAVLERRFQVTAL